MTISDINAFVSSKGRTNTTQYTAANRLISTNRWYQKIVTMILESQDEWDWDDSNRSDFPEATTDLVASQQDYNFPGTLKILKIKRVEVKLDGSNWVKAQPMDISEVGTPTDTTSIAADFTTDVPYYDVTATGLKLYPIPTSNVTGGLKVWYQREPAEFTSAEVSTGTKEPGFDEAWHPMIPLGMLLDYPDLNKEIRKDVRDELVDYENRLRRYYSRKQQDRQYVLTSGLPTNYGK